MTMNITRRHLLAGSAGLAVVAGLPAAAQTVTSINMLVPAAPGGGWDQTARTMQQVLAASGIAPTMQITNQGGAGGTIGLANFLNNQRGRADAMMTTGLVMMGAILTNKTPVNLSMTTPIARLTGEYQVLVTPARSRFNTLADFVAALRANPGAVPVAGGSAGGTDHITLGLLAKVAGADPTKINYVAHAGGGEAQAALLGNHVAGGISGWGEFSAQVAAGRLRALAIFAPQRLPGIDAPTAKEQGIDLEVPNWRGVVAAPGITDAQRQALLNTIDAMVKTPQWQEVLTKNNWGNLYLAGADFARYIEEENRRMTEVLKSIGLVN
ncbi:MAG: tripartite tricarboxylate transporter substrate binding protein [Alphaproteobacteria bacterium]|nr:tripartite tricarboxylate transporter substrate-binding protein [Alphaproteobacteria bacterium]TAD90588.1 MAG: tripartite tricarboxylate transporter substrate binding protein [Alphaproteobacteria bacterium]